MRYNPIVQLSLSRVREFLREPEAVFWVFIFPILLALALGIAFKSGGSEELAVGVQQGPGAERCRAILDRAEGLRAAIYSPEDARDVLRTGKVALVVIPDEPWTYWYDPARAESRLARLAVDDAIQAAEGRADVRVTKNRELTEKGSRYIDFLIPGLLGMNLMGTGIWGIGFNIVNARSKRLLKRLVATPMRRSHFLLSQLIARLVFLVLEVAALILFARYAFDVPLRGSLAALLFVSLLGAMTFGGLGLLVACRARTLEGVSGLMNLVMAPMWIFSGVFFSTARFPELMQPLIQALPLTAINDALRAVMLDGATLWEISGEVAIAGVWALGSFVLALSMFRWS